MDDLLNALAKAREEELEYMKDKPIEFIETYVHIEDKEAPELIVPFRPWEAQKEILQELFDHRLSIVLKARQLGFTWMALSLAAHLMLCKRKGCLVIGLSRTEDEAKELVRRLGVVILGNMNELVRRENWGGVKLETTALEVRLVHPCGKISVFKAFPSSSGAGRSFTADMLILDEWAFQQYAREIFLSVFPTINRPTSGQIIGLSTIERGSLFEEIWRGDYGFHKIFAPWNIDPRRDDEWYESTKKTLGPMITQEYPATEEEALTIPGGMFFPEFKPATHCVPFCDTEGKRLYVSLDYGLDGLAVLWYAVDPQGDVCVYRQLYRTGLIVPKAAEAIAEANGNDSIYTWFAPPDLWNRNRDTGRSTAEVFSEYGINLVKTSNVREQGCLNMKEYLMAREYTNEQTGQVSIRPRLTVSGAPDLVRCLQLIQRDKRKPNEYANDPHELTHMVDSLRAFCCGRPLNPDKEEDNDYFDEVEDFISFGR